MSSEASETNSSEPASDDRGAPAEEFSPRPLGPAAEGSGTSAEESMSSGEASPAEPSEPVQSSAQDLHIEQRRSWRSAQESIEAVVVAILLALLLRHFALEAFVIPTGSMAPTLLGEHLRVICPSCRQVYPMGRVDGGFESRCQLCEATTSAWSSEVDGQQVQMNWALALRPPGLRESPIFAGDKILVDKAAYRGPEPERFDVVVFKYPKEPQRNFIKRLIGLPGERVAIRGGDIVINGQRVQKPEAVQEVLWRPIYKQSSPLPEARDEPWSSTDKDRWQLRRRGEALDQVLEIPGLEREAFIAWPGASPTSLVFDRAIRDHESYNPTAARNGIGVGAEHYIADLRIEASVRSLGAADEDGLVLSITINGFDYSLRMPTLAAQPLRIEAARRVLAEAAVRPLEAGQIRRLRFEHLDGALRAWLDGELSLSTPAPALEGAVSSSGLSLRAPASGAVFEKIELWRDVQYFDRGPPPDMPEIFDVDRGEYLIPSGHFLMFGDNQPSSSDSRAWGLVARGHIVGRAFMIFWPPQRFGPIR